MNLVRWLKPFYYRLFPEWPLAVSLEIEKSVSRIFVNYPNNPYRTLDLFLEIIDEIPERFRQNGIYRLNDTQVSNVYSSVCQHYLQLVYWSLLGLVYPQLPTIKSELLYLHELRRFIIKLFAAEVITEYKFYFNLEKWERLDTELERLYRRRLERCRFQILCWKIYLYCLDTQLLRCQAALFSEQLHPPSF